MDSAFTTVEDVEKYLNSIPKFSNSGKSASNFNLYRMVAFCSEMGNPEKKFRSVHVAGTNGKGTVCRMFSSVYRTAGYKTGLYTSPHLLRVQERFRVDDYEISADQLLEFFRLFGRHIEDSAYTFFEITTAVAFWYFAREGVDIAIIETGLGGRLDATNVINSEISVITSIGMDHTDILGNTLASIAFEKGGIIKENKPVIIGELQKEAEDVLAEIAKKHRSDLIRATDLSPELIDKTVTLSTTTGSLSIQLDGKKIDAMNVAMVYQGVQILEDLFPVTLNEFTKGIEVLRKNYPVNASFEQLTPEKKWYFDGAHNFDATKLLTEHLFSVAPADEWSVVLSFSKDKLSPEVGGLWSDFPNLFVWQMEGERAASAEEMIHLFPHATVIHPDEKKVTNLFETELVIFSGSFYFYHVVSSWMGTKSNSH
ncbi:MAG: hypothetical protein JJU37_14530 [Balneolaceae bacterium]|nr:hypothetical protein [Balneolaceae bacterium]